MTRQQQALKQQFTARIKRREKIIGRTLLQQPLFGLGELMISCNGEFALSTVSLGVHTPAFVVEKKDGRRILVR
jgi:hypothetical protein